MITTRAPDGANKIFQNKKTSPSVTCWWPNKIFQNIKNLSLRHQEDRGLWSDRPSRSTGHRAQGCSITPRDVKAITVCSIPEEGSAASKIFSPSWKSWPVPLDSPPHQPGAKICRLRPGCLQFCRRRHPEQRWWPYDCMWNLLAVVEKSALQVVLTCEAWSWDVSSHWEVFDGKFSWLEERIGYNSQKVIWFVRFGQYQKNNLTFPMSLLQNACSSWQRQQAMFGVSLARSVHARHSTGLAFMTRLSLTSPLSL